MPFLAGLFLIAHGLVHVPVWIAAPPEGAPFDARHSWLLGEPRGLVQTLAIVAALLFAIAGTLVIAGAGPGAGLAIAAAAVSLLLVALTFNRWLLGAVAINLAIVAIALG